MSRQNYRKLHQLAASTKAKAEKQLAELGRLDRETSLKSEEYQIRTAAFLQRASNQEDVQANQEELKDMLSQISQLEDEIETLSDRKVKLANAIYCTVANSCDEFDRTVGDQWISQMLALCNSVQGLQYRHSQQLDDILQDELKQELLNFCTCQGKFQGPVIFCSMEECSKRWYHLRCMKIVPSKVPKGNWVCPNCR